MDVKTLCLGVLMRRSASGYAIKKEFESGVFSHFCEAGFGSIYPALNRLWTEGLVVAREEAGDGRPDRRVYEITPAGREAFVDSLLEPPGPDRFRSDELFILFFAEWIPPRRVAAIIDARLKRLRAEKQEIDACIASMDRAAAEDATCGNAHPGSAFVRDYGNAIISAEIAFLEANKDRLVEATRTTKHLSNAAD